MNVILDTKLLAHGRANIVETLDVIAKVIQRALDARPFTDKLNVFCCADIGKSSYRLGLFDKYKSGRFYGDPEEYQRFKKDYTDGLLPILHHFGVHVFDIQELEADDQVSILVNSILPKDEPKYIVTEDRDWLQSVLSVPNTLWLSPRTFQISGVSKVIELTGMHSKAHFIAKKCILGDAGDNIKPSAILCGPKCFDEFFGTILEDPKSTEGSYEEQLQYIKSRFLEFIDGKPKHKVHKDYLGTVETVDEAWDLNVKLGTTMVDFSHLTALQKKLFEFKLRTIPKLSPKDTIDAEIARLVPHQSNPFGGTITIPNELYRSFERFYNINQRSPND